MNAQPILDKNPCQGSLGQNMLAAFFRLRTLHESYWDRVSVKVEIYDLSWPTFLGSCLPGLKKRGVGTYWKDKPEYKTVKHTAFLPMSNFIFGKQIDVYIRRKWTHNYTHIYIRESERISLKKVVLCYKMLDLCIFKTRSSLRVQSSSPVFESSLDEALLMYSERIYVLTIIVVGSKKSRNIRHQIAIPRIAASRMGNLWLIQFTIYGLLRDTCGRTQSVVISR